MCASKPGPLAGRDICYVVGTHMASLNEIPSSQVSLHMHQSDNKEIDKLHDLTVIVEFFFSDTVMFYQKKKKKKRQIA